MMQITKELRTLGRFQIIIVRDERVRKVFLINLKSFRLKEVYFYHNTYNNKTKEIP